MLIQCQNQSEWVAAIETELGRFTGQMQVFLPAGETPKPLYEKWRHEFPANLKSFKFQQVDEILDGGRRFEQFFKDELPQVSVAQVGEGNVVGDIAVLGLGLNGHVGFHEPHVDPHFFSGCVRLDHETCHKLKLKDGTWGVTYGVGAFLKCRSILLIVRGESKQEVLSSVLKKDLRLPAAHLVGPNLKIINLRN